MNAPAVVEQTAKEATRSAEPVRVLIVFNTVCLYGMELTVIESFDRLRPHVEPVFLLPRATERRKGAVLQEIERRGLKYSFFSDDSDWPRIRRPRSWKEAWRILSSVGQANWDVLRAAREQRFIYIPISTGLYLSSVAALLFRLKGRRVIYSFHDLTVERFFPLRLAQIWISDIVHMTDLGRETLVRVYPFLAHKRNYVIPPVADIQSRSQDRQSELRDYSTHRNVVFIGQVSKHKGVDILLQAFERIASRREDATLHIVGGSSWEYGGDFTAAVARTGLADRIRHWGYCSDVRQFLEIADVYVQPSLPSVCHEAFGRGVVEAMSMGVPAVCFRSGALTELVEHEQTGLLCEEESPECLAASIERLLADPGLRQRLGRRAKERFEERYSSDRICQRWLQLMNLR